MTKDCLIGVKFDGEKEYVRFGKVTTSFLRQLKTTTAILRFRQPVWYGHG